MGTLPRKPTCARSTASWNKSAAKWPTSSRCIALTRDPASSSAADIAALRSAGIVETDILLANLIIAYFNFVNRIALGLGVESSAAEIAGYSV
jgi:hypothetical protein